MRPAVMMNLLIQTSADATTVRDFVNGRILSVEGRVLVEQTSVINWHRNLFLVNAYVYCPTSDDAGVLYNEVIDTWSTPPHRNRIEVGSWVKRIDSYEDEGLPDQMISMATKT